MVASVPRNPFPVYTPEVTTVPPDREAAEQPQAVATAPPGMPLGGLGKESRSWRDRLLKLYNDNTGLLLICASQFFNSSMNVSVQMLNRMDVPIPPTEILLIRMSVTWVLTVAYMHYERIPYPITGPPEVRPLLVIRGICGFCGVFGMYYSLQYLSLSDATVLTFLSPFFTSFAGTFFLGETFSHRKLFAGLVSLVGVVLIARPEALFGPSGPRGRDSGERGTPQQRILAVVVALFGVCGISGAYTSIRAVGKRAHTLHNMTFFALIATIISASTAVLGVIEIVTPTRLGWGLIVLISCFGFTAQFLMISGLRRETASRGSLGMYMQIVFASLLGRIFFHATPSVLSVIGTVIILSSAIYVGLTKDKDEPKLDKKLQDDSTLPSGGHAAAGSIQGYSIHTAGERTPLLGGGLTVPHPVIDHEQDKKADMASHV